ncbi:MAG: hypothetical protein L6R41_007933 [Letrouitia leprolyta]|nr:MAG: hypothetical protein L6R41_007933 [Letrouitia leprolyta]
MCRLSILAASACVLSFAKSFCVDFNSADQCTGTLVGQYKGSGVSGCQSSFQKPNSLEYVPGAGKSSNVIITPQADDKKHGVAFYGREDCEVLIGFGNVPVCTGVGAWASFQIVTIDEADDDLTNLDPAPILSISPNATETAPTGDHLTVSSAMLGSVSAAVSTTGGVIGSTGVTGIKGASGTVQPIETGTTSQPTSATQTGNTISMSTSTATPLRKRTVSTPELTKRVAHGSTQTHHGRLFKYHQVAARVWRGVPADQWNEKIHKRVTRDHTITRLRRHEQPYRFHPRAIGPVGGSSPINSRPGISTRSLNTLTKKDILPSKCNLVRTCMIDNGDNDNFGIYNAGPALLSAVDALNGAGDHWQFLENPLVVEVVDDSGQSLGYIYAQTRQEHSDVESCSDRNNEADALKSALEMGVDGSTVSDMRVDLKSLTGRGVTNTLFVSTRKAGTADMRIHPICEAIQLYD